MTDIENMEELINNLNALVKAHRGEIYSIVIDDETKPKVLIARDALDKYERAFDTVAKRMAHDDVYDQYVIYDKNIKFMALEEKNESDH